MEKAELKFRSLYLKKGKKNAGKFPGFGKALLKEGFQRNGETCPLLELFNKRGGGEHFLSM